MKRLIILRPGPGAGASVERGRAAGLETEPMPLFEIRPLPWTAPDPTRFDGILMTSANAPRHGGPELAKLKSLPVHAVGEATAAAARAAGFQVATVGTGGAAELAAKLRRGERLLHLAGRNRRDTGASETIPVYESAELPPPAALWKLSEAVVAVHSPRAGRRLAELVEDRTAITIAAISQAAAEACGAGWERVEVAAMPGDAALLALAAQLCKNTGE